MAVQLLRVDPFAHRDAIVDFMWRNGAWPYATKAEYFGFWDWRYRSLSESDPAVWVLRDGELIVGHVALHYRRFALGAQPVRVGVPGNFRVDDRYLNTVAGAMLASAPRKLVQRGELDLVVACHNEIGQAVAVALGYHDLGEMQALVAVPHWDRFLGRRAAWLAAVAPLAHAADATRRFLRRCVRRPPPDFLAARLVSADELRAFDTSHWQRDPRLTWAGSLDYFGKRFSTCPFQTARIYAVIDERTGRLEGVLAAIGEAMLSVLECEVNQNVMAPPQAVELLLRAHPGADSVRVSLLPSSQLAEEFATAGYLRLPTSLFEEILDGDVWSAYWQPSHPLAALLENTDSWKLWHGWSARNYMDYALQHVVQAAGGERPEIGALG
jgi:hypothetical protein